MSVTEAVPTMKTVMMDPRMKVSQERKVAILKGAETISYQPQQISGRLCHSGQ